MNSRYHLSWILGIGLCSAVFAEADEPANVGIDTACAEETRVRDVLVLDLEPFLYQPELAEGFIEEQVGGYRLLSTNPEEMITPYRPSKDPHGVTRRAQKLGAKNGCDLVFVLKTGPYFGRQRNARSPRIKDKGYAFVVMGQRATR